MAKQETRTVLFLCTGNYYRSRFAECVFNSIAGKMGLPWQASSRGLALERGVNNIGPMAVSAISALNEMGFRAADALSRMPEQVTTRDLEQADRIVALKLAEHLPLLLERFPGWADRVEFWQVDDAPAALAQIERELMSFVARILGGPGSTDSSGSMETAKITSKVAADSVKERPEAKVGRETAGRRGKGVTTVFGLALNETGLLELAAKLKQRCGTGGTVKDGRIEIQGDQRERVTAELERLGFRVKRSGG